MRRRIHAASLDDNNVRGLKAVHVLVCVKKVGFFESRHLTYIIVILCILVYVLPPCVDAHNCGCLAALESICFLCATLATWQ